MRNYEMDDGSWDIEREHADYKQAELERLGTRAHTLKKRGICVHGWRQGYSSSMPDKYRGIIKPGHALCLDCGKVSTHADLDTERNAHLGNDR